MRFMNACRPRWWLAALQVFLLLATLVTPAVAAPSPSALSGTQLIDLLRSYNIVKGDPQGNLLLDKPIKRGEMMTIMVRALGKEEEAKSYKGWGNFTDIKGHWAEANITYAAIKGLVKGDGNNAVRPEDPITYGEALTLILRLVGKEPTTGEWPLNVLIAAIDLGIMPPGITAADVKTPAVRGLIFMSMGTTITTVKTAEGKTFLQTYVDPTDPLITWAPPASTTKDASIKVSGTVEGATSVTVNDKAVTLSGKTFSTDVALEYGDNTITVSAVDLAGNVASKEAKVTRVPPIATLEITGPNKVRPGGTVNYIVSAKNSSGAAVTLSGVTAKVEGNIGTFDLNSGRFNATNTPGKGKIVLSAGPVSKTMEIEVMGQNASANRLGIRTINDGRAVSYTKPMTVTVEVQDALGQFLDTDYGRPVALSITGMQSATVSPLIAYTEAGVASFTVNSNSAMGIVTLSASSDKLTNTARTAEFGTNLRLRLSADPTNLLVGSVQNQSRIRAVLVDENGSVVNNNTSSDMYIQLTASSSGTTGNLVDPYIRILRGTSSSNVSGDEGIFTVGIIAGSTTITGNVTSSHSITVDPVTLTTTVPSIGSGTQWDLIGSLSQTPNFQSEFFIRLADGSGNTVPGNWAFQLNISTSNNEPKTNGIPQGVTLTLGNSLNPVSDGVAEGAANDGNDVVVRTAGGVAQFKVTYNKPGQVYISVSPTESTTNGYASDGTVGNAASVGGVPNRTFTMNYTTTPVAVKLLVDSDGLGENQTVGATSNNSGKAFTLRALLTDGSGNWVPGSIANVTLTKVSGTATTAPTTTTVSTSDGKATFMVYATGNPGEDVYKVSAGLAITVDSSPLSLFVQNMAPAAPSILAIRGTNNGIPGSLNYVAPGDTGVEVELAQDPAQRWAVIKVYTEGNGTPLFTSSPIDMGTVAPRIVIAKSALPTGIYRYQVVVKNGYGESGRSTSSNQITNSTFVANVALSSAKYHRTNKTLTLYGTGYSNVTDNINPALLTIRDASTTQTISLAGAQATINNWSQITVNLTGMTAVTNSLENPMNFTGSDVTVTAGAGWYTRTNGEQSAAITTGAPVSPMANIRHVEYDRVNSRLYLVGDGFNGINLDLAKLKLQATGATDLNLNTFGSSRLSDTLWQFNLTGPAVTALDATGAYTLTALDGWAYDGSWTQTALPVTSVYGQVSLASATYDKVNHKLSINGSGFTGGTVAIGNLQITDLSSNQTVTLSGTYSITSDSKIEFTLDNAAYSLFENTLNFQGADIYLLASANWFTNAAGRPAAGIPVRTLRLPAQ